MRNAEEGIPEEKIFLLKMHKQTQRGGSSQKTRVQHALNLAIITLNECVISIKKIRFTLKHLIKKEKVQKKARHIKIWEKGAKILFNKFFKIKNVPRQTINEMQITEEFDIGRDFRNFHEFDDVFSISAMEKGIVLCV